MELNHGALSLNPVYNRSKDGAITLEFSIEDTIRFILDCGYPKVAFPEKVGGWRVTGHEYRSITGATIKDYELGATLVLNCIDKPNW